jgi:hypothetical protein
MFPWVLSHGIHQEGPLDTNIAMMRAGSLVGIGEWKENLLKSAVAVMAAKKEVIPVICKPIIPRVLGLQFARLSDALFWSKMFYG